MKVTFWGVRGSIATSGPEFHRIGGNTTCLEVEAGGERLVLDAGTGLRPLGQKLAAEARERQGRVCATFLFTHLHWDHIQGFPFFGPGFVPGTELRLLGPGEGGSSLEHALSEQMRPPSFPVPLEAMAAEKRFETLSDGAELELGAVKVKARALCHPQGSLGYRIEAGGASFCFATDTEALPGGEVDPALLELARDVDLLVYDAQYTPDEYAGKAGPPRKGWGHSTYVDAARIAKACGAKRLGLFHHDPTHGDDLVEAMERDARTIFPAAFACREGLTVGVP